MSDSIDLLGGELCVHYYSSDDDGQPYFYEAEVSNPAMAQNAVERGHLPDSGREV
jgi:hypothetical protein